MKKTYKKEFSFEWKLNMRFTLMIMAELLIITVVAWAIAKILNVTLDFPLGVWMVILSVILGGAINNFFSRRFFAPIIKLGKAMQKVAEGDFSIRLDTKDELNEIREIYSNFNLMVKELSATEILQTDFVSNVSHEFKTPISAIEGYATLLQGQDHVSAEENEKYIEKILLNTRRLSHLVGNILLLSKIDNQAIQSQSILFRLDEQIRQSIVMLEPEWSKKDIEFEADLEEIEYEGNESLLRHVWDNLIGNAIKFSPQNGGIRIEMKKESDHIVCLVEDHGPGINKEAQKRIYDKFYQGDNSHKDEGNGLGLALVKDILDLCGGSIAIENMPSGGCRASVILK